MIDDDAVLQLPSPARVLFVFCLAGCTSKSAPDGRASDASATATATTESSTASAATTVASVSPAPSAVPAAGAPEGMLPIPEGYFVMGGESPENTPKHEVAVAAFYMDRLEVSVDAYAACVKASVCQPMRTNNPFCNSHFPGNGKHAVNCVDWNDANAYCGWQKKRLPTEEEWEYAARGGSEQRLYSWGTDEPTPQRSCYMHSGTCEVGIFPAGAFGLHDMTGNVWEWTSSWFVPYDKPGAPGFVKINRGGSWSRRFAKWMRNDLRSRFKPEEQSAAHGFRCAADAPPLKCPVDAEAKDGVCVRTKGEPTCPPGQTCKTVVPLSPVSQASAQHPRPVGTGLAASAASASAKPEDGPPKQVRAPVFDKDCQSHFPGTPVGYQWTGGTFQAREPLIRGAGCKKRDVGVGWTSTCCPQ